MNDTTDRKRVIVALDGMTLEQACAMTDQVKAESAGVKVGFELLCDEGARVIADSLSYSRVFYDPKLHDIPNTVDKAVRRLVNRGAWIINLHCSGGPKMMQAARRAVDEESTRLGLDRKPLLIGVTVLTSMDFSEFERLGIFARTEPPAPAVDAIRIRGLVINMAELAQSCGLDGVVASPLETKNIRELCGPNFKIITPGIRLSDAKADDQVRIATPAGAINAGADWLVVGRPITESANPLQTLQIINLQVAEALAGRR